MSRKEWQVVEGAGERYLEMLGHNAALWNRYGESLPVVQTIAKLLEERAERIAISTVSESLTSDRLESPSEVVGRLDAADQTELAQAYLARTAVTELVALQKGTFGISRLSRPRVRARLHVEGAGVRHVFHVGRYSPGSHLTPTDTELSPGRELEGNVFAFYKRPEVGGYLCLKRAGVVYTHVSGLVDPASGELRVHLDILRKV